MDPERRSTRPAPAAVGPAPPPPPPADADQELPVARKSKKKKLTKAEKKELKRQREIEFKKLEMRSEFRRELELSRKTALKLKVDWADSIRDMKLMELREALQVWEEKVTRQFSEKDEKIQNMLTLLDSMEEMNQFVSSRVKAFFDYITGVLSTLTRTCKVLYEDFAVNSITEFRESLQDRAKQHDAWQLHCENVMHLTNFIFEQELLNDYNIFVERRNDNVNIAIERRYRIRDRIVNKMKASRQQLSNFVEQITSTNLDPHKYERIRQLMGRQRTFYEESIHLIEVETKQWHSYNDLQRELLQSELKIQKKLNDLRLEQTYFIEIRRGIEESIEQDRLLTFDKLKILSKESYIVIKHFEKLRDYGELLLSIAANVRKLQTESEKVVMWGDFATSENKSELQELRKFVLTVINPHTHLDCYDEDVYTEMNLMRVFWQRMAIVETQNSMLMKEKQELETENKKYTDFIRTMHKGTEPDRLPDALLITSLVATFAQCPECD